MGRVAGQTTTDYSQQLQLLRQVAYQTTRLLSYHLARYLYTVTGANVQLPLDRALILHSYARGLCSQGIQGIQNRGFAMAREELQILGQIAAGIRSEAPIEARWNRACTSKRICYTGPVCK